MAYQARRAKNQVEIFELVNDDDEVVNRFEVRVDVGGLGKRLSEKFIALNRAKNALQQASSDNEKMIEACQLAITEMLCTVFGEDAAQEIIQFYDKNYIEIYLKVMPFVTETVLPKTRKFDQELRKQAMQSYIRR